MPILMMAMCVSSFSACSSDDDDSDGGSNGGLIGYWVQMDDFRNIIRYTLGKSNRVEDDGTIMCDQITYHFIDNNTLEETGIKASINKRADSFKSETIDGVPVYYFFDNDWHTSYTYEKIDNKIYIPSAGVILTYDGSTLRKDGENDVFTKVK